MLEGFGSKWCMNFEGFTNPASAPRTTYHKTYMASLYFFQLWKKKQISNTIQNTCASCPWQQHTWKYHNTLKVEYVSTWMLVATSHKLRSHKSWGRKMPKISWPPNQLPLSTSGNWDHWCVWQIHCPSFELSYEETCWCIWWSQGAPVAPPASVPGCGQGKCCQHIGLCASLI